MDLKKARDEIEKIDAQILELIAKRFDVVKEVGKYKKENGIKVKDKNREKEVINKACEKLRSQGYADARFIQKLFKTIMKKSRALQK